MNYEKFSDVEDNSNNLIYYNKLNHIKEIYEIKNKVIIIIMILDIDE